LFEIERAPYEAVVAQRKADLAAAAATQKNAQLTIDRYQTQRQKGTVSEAEMDQAVADQASAQAKVLQAQAALQSAELDLGYTTISSPIAGRISQARYSVGSLVGPGSDPLASVTSLDPIYITIAVSEKDLLEARRQGIDLENPPVAPFLTLSDGSQYARDGRFDYLDSRVNQSTDTITARAVFPNPERILVPGQFVTVTVRQKQPVSAIVVPQAAVQRDQQGYFVLVVDQANQVEVRRIEVGDQTGSDWVISQGLAAGERVIVQGIQKVRPDMVVNPVTAGN
jgi:membrane fusion protein (multidrug efflux system)